jgi:uncharacterized protein
LANAFSKPRWREKAISLIDHLAARDDVEIEPFSASLWADAWALYCSRSDKSWSLTDCVSFNCMQQQRLTVALTADAHFQQAGFRALLLE